MSERKKFTVYTDQLWKSISQPSYFYSYQEPCYFQKEPLLGGWRIHTSHTFSLASLYYHREIAIQEENEEEETSFLFEFEVGICDYASESVVRKQGQKKSKSRSFIEPRETVEYQPFWSGINPNQEHLERPQQKQIQKKSAITATTLPSIAEREMVIIKEEQPAHGIGSSISCRTCLESLYMIIKLNDKIEELEHELKKSIDELSEIKKDHQNSRHKQNYMDEGEETPTFLREIMDKYSHNLVQYIIKVLKANIAQERQRSSINNVDSNMISYSAIFHRSQDQPSGRERASSSNSRSQSNSSMRIIQILQQSGQYSITSAIYNDFVEQERAQVQEFDNDPNITRIDNPI